MHDIKIVLANGVEIPCKSFGYRKDVYAPFIFNTSIVGYQEALTDPSYKKEILVMSFPIQGIYGINDIDSESDKIHLSAFVVNSFEKNFSNNHATISIEDFLNKHKIQGVTNVDTRFLIKQIREKGSMLGAIVSIDESKEEVLKKIEEMRFEEHVQSVSPKEIEVLNPKGKKYIVFYDFGAKNNIMRELIGRNYKVTRVPHNTTAKKVMELNPDFVFLSNGPGDPAELTSIVKEVKTLIDNKVRIAGICLGHQLISLALGAKTERLKFGHHASNHPVKNVETGKVYITSQNHNYAVINGTLPEGVKVFLTSLNDESIEGLKSEKYGVISTQFHPEAAPGPTEAREFFDLFIEFIKGGK